MARLEDRLRTVERFCARTDLRSYDPYDIWKTSLGFRVKDLYNRRRGAGLLPAAALTLFDTYLNNRLRWGYQAQEYPVVRAWAALALMNLQAANAGSGFLPVIRAHLDWLRSHASSGGSGLGWGIGFRQPISAGLHYEASLPLATMTPYALEAFVRFHALTGDESYRDLILGIHRFFDRDLQVMEETPEYLVTSYSTLQDRRVVNAVSYVMYSLSLLRPWLDEAERAAATRKIGKLYRYLVVSQRADGSWLYSPDGPPFIDCFHSCIVLKNLIRADRLVALPDAGAVIGRGYEYLLRSFRDPATGLFRRFSLENKPSLVRFDLYDNAEVVNLALLMGDRPLAAGLADAVEQAFVRGADIWSQVDRFGLRHNRNTLRWAVMPWLYALSVLET